MEETQQQPMYPGKQLQTLKKFYGLTLDQIAENSNVSIGTIHKALQGDSAVDLRKFAAIADALNADVVITLRARDSHVRDHVKALLSEVSAIQ
jgi:transcriptional regulator with XRE-family HTH domain